jgi:hypothetical protein
MLYFCHLYALHVSIDVKIINTGIGVIKIDSTNSLIDSGCSSIAYRNHSNGTDAVTVVSTAERRVSITGTVVSPTERGVSITGTIVSTTDREVSITGTIASTTERNIDYRDDRIDYRERSIDCRDNSIDYREEYRLHGR